jgi:RimJ/RimL family protein N-acetyltransferase
VTLVRASDGHFAWLIGEAVAPDDLQMPDEGVESPGILRMLRRMTAALHAADCPASWLIVADAMVVGLCSFKGPPDSTGVAEIGYGVAAGHRGKGHAREAVRLMIADVMRDRLAIALFAETSVANVASQSVLECNGFVRSGERSDPEDGALIQWTRPLN